MPSREMRALNALMNPEPPPARPEPDTMIGWMLDGAEGMDLIFEGHRTPIRLPHWEIQTALDGIRRTEERFSAEDSITLIFVPLRRYVTGGRQTVNFTTT